MSVLDRYGFTLNFRSPGASFHSHDVPICCLAALQWAAANITQLAGDVERLAVAGESAGGTLAASVAQVCRDQGPRIAAQLLAYPPTDLVGNYGVETENAMYPSRVENAGYFVPTDAMHFFASQYVASDERHAIHARRRYGRPTSPACLRLLSVLRSLIRYGMRARHMRARSKKPALGSSIFVKPRWFTGTLVSRAAFKTMLL